MNKYSLEVRGETVHLTFTRVNDSRRLGSSNSHKNPNLFGISAAMLCEADVPLAFAVGALRTTLAAGLGAPGVILPVIVRPLLAPPPQSTSNIRIIALMNILICPISFRPMSPRSAAMGTGTNAR